ncbi:hypothetical protein [Synechococcus sp. UW179B]|uniref:hypothetical protein n=1 Tax=Synechococcus sp. UW179B TaxID=2575516 RepID=UPI000E0F207A|nr:hypothetical protein [Synechococcus sp. UW179B]
MDKSGRRQASIRWFAALFALILLFGTGQPVLAIPSLPWANQPNSKSAPNQGKNLPTQNPSGRLREVEPPGAVQQLQQALAKHHPQLSLISPLDGSQLKEGGPLNLELKIEDWPLANDRELGLGAHVAIQIDDQAPIRISERNGNRVTLELPPLSPGSHRFTAYAAYPWGEAVKTPGASLHWAVDQLRPLMGTQPKRDAPWLAMVSPAELGGDSPLLLDWLVWNAPLQNLRAGDARWRLRITVDEDSFVVDQQDALWLQGIDNRKGINTVQMELLNGIGESLEPMFNNQLRVVPERQNPKPIWLQSSLNDSELARLLGETKPEDPSARQELVSEENVPQAQGGKNAETKPEALKPQALSQQAVEGRGLEENDLGEKDSGDKAKDSGEKGFEEKAGDNKTEEIGPLAEKALEEGEQNKDAIAVDSEAVEGELAKPEALNTGTEKATSLPNEEMAVTAMPEKGADTTKKPSKIANPEPERIAPTSTLGGSARELLNADGTQR